MNPYDGITLAVTLIVGIIGTLITSWILAKMRSYNDKEVEKNIANFSAQRKTLDVMNASVYELNRLSFKAIFVLLFLFGCANVAPVLVDAIFADGLSSAKAWVSIFFWWLFLLFTLVYLKRDHQLANYPDAIKKLEALIDREKKKRRKG